MSSSFEPVPSERLEVTSEVGAALTDFDYRVAASLLKLTHALRLPKDTIGYLVERMALDSLQIPVSQLSGFSTFTAQFAPIITAAQTTTSTSYVDLATIGPTLSGLPDGKYVLIWGCQAFCSASSDEAIMAVGYNGAATDNTVQARTNQTVDYTSIVAFNIQTLSAGSNSVLAKYKTGTSATFSNRSLLALKYDEL